MTTPFVVVVVSTSTALLRAGGRTILGRAVEMLRRADLSPGLIVCDESLVSRVRAESSAWGAECRVASAGEEAGVLDSAGDHLLLVAGHVVYDPRLIETVRGWTEPTALFDSAAPDGEAFAGISLLRRADVEAALAAGGSLLAPAELVHGITGVGRVDIEDLPRYARALRRELRPFWIPVRDESDLPRVRKTLAHAAGKGHQEWYVVIVNRPVETFLSYYVAEWSITPNQITFISNITAYAATVLLALGHLWWAFGFIVATTILDGLDGRQARIQIKTSKIGEWEHVFDAISEVSWMAALTYFFYERLGNADYAYLGAAWLAFYAVDNYAYTFFRIRRGMMLDEASAIDHAVRFVGSRRNTSFPYFFMALALGYPVEGFWFVVGFAGLTALVHWLRVAMLLANK